MSVDQLKKPNYQNFRVCYNLEDTSKSTKIYELYKYCKCEDCQHRLQWKRQPANRITVTTKDILKVDEIAEFLKKWNCKDGKSLLEIEFVSF